jgi:hypothetical protein
MPSSRVSEYDEDDIFNAKSIFAPSPSKNIRKVKSQLTFDLYREVVTREHVLNGKPRRSLVLGVPAL